MTDQLLHDYSATRRALGGVGQTKVDQLCDDGQLKRVHIGRRAFVTARSIAEYVDQLEQNSLDIAPRGDAA